MFLKLAYLPLKLLVSVLKASIFALEAIGLIQVVALWKFDVLKASIFALEALLLGQIFVLRTSNFRRATINR